MKKIFLTSDMGCSKKIDGIRYAQPIDDRNGIIKLLKENINKEENFLYFASNPNDYEKSSSHAKLIFESFKMSGFNFSSFIVVDGRYKGNLKDDINNADLIFLTGGKTLTQMKFFDEIHLKELLESYNGVIIGQSAGSMNLADKVVCSPEDEEEIGTDYIWDGLGQTGINIEPHFKLEVKEELDTKLRKELLQLSINNTLYAITDGSYIFDDGDTQTIYGEAYLLNNGNIENICNNGETKILKEKIVER